LPELTDRRRARGGGGEFTSGWEGSTAAHKRSGRGGRRRPLRYMYMEVNTVRLTRV